MKLCPIFLLAVLVATGGAVTPALGTDNVYHAVSVPNWHVNDNWSLGWWPRFDENAVIPAGEECLIWTHDPDAVADSIEVYGTLTIDGGRKLSLSGVADSTLDGSLEVIGTLVIKTDLTIGVVQDAGEILMASGCSIDDDTDNWAELTTEVPIRGCGYIKVTLVNNASVVTDRFSLMEQSPLYLTEGSKSGSGFWEAKINGELVVDLGTGKSFSGAGTWQIIDNSADVTPKITIKTCCDLLTGDVILKNGIFRAEESFCTTGDLTWQSVEKGGGGYTSPKFEVVQGKSATFGGSCQDICP